MPSLFSICMHLNAGMLLINLLHILLQAVNLPCFHDNKGDTFFYVLTIVNNIITTIMEIKGKVNTDTINVHKGELMEYKNQTENRAFQEMLQAAVKRLQNRSGEDIAAKSGAVFHSSRNVLEVLSFYETIEIQLPEFRINSDMDEWHYLTLLHYLDMADGTEGSQKLITFGNLKDGLIRGTKFDRTAEQKLEKLLQDKDPEKIQKACKNLGAEFTETKADLCAVFPVLPRYPVTLKIWFADEEFPASGKIFLQDHADHYLSVEDAVTVGEILLQKLSEAFSSL